MKKIIITFVLAVFSVFAIACNSAGDGGSATGGKVVKTHTAENLKVALSTDDGVIREGKEEFTLAFTDASGNPVKMNAVSVNFHMPAMGTMAVMNDPATITSTAQPGVYKGTVNLQMGGEWQVQIAYEGAAGSGKTSFPITAQ